MAVLLCPVPPGSASGPSRLGPVYRGNLVASSGALACHQYFLGQPDPLALGGPWAHGGGFVLSGPEGYLPGPLSFLRVRLGGQTADFRKWALNPPQTQVGVLPACQQCWQLELRSCWVQPAGAHMYCALCGHKEPCGEEHLGDEEDLDSLL